MSGWQAYVTNLTSQGIVDVRIRAVISRDVRRRCRRAVLRRRRRRRRAGCAAPRRHTPPPPPPLPARDAHRVACRCIFRCVQVWIGGHDGGVWAATPNFDWIPATREAVKGACRGDDGGTRAHTAAEGRRALAHSPTHGAAAARRRRKHQRTRTHRVAAASLFVTR